MPQTLIAATLFPVLGATLAVPLWLAFYTGKLPWRALDANERTLCRPYAFLTQIAGILVGLLSIANLT